VINLTTLEIGAEMADILQMYKIMMGIERVIKEEFFERDDGRERELSMKLFKKRVRLYIAKYSFGNRMCDQWNKLPAGVVSSQGLIY